MFKTIATILLLGSLALAADAPKLNEVDTLKVQNGYLTALLAQKDFQKQIDQYNALIADVKKVEGLPADSTISVGPDNKTVTITLPVDKTPKK